MAKNEMSYAYAFDKGGKLSRYFGVSGIPHAVLIDAGGTVVWEGHPASLDATLLQQAMTGALPKPLWEWPSEAKAAKTALLKHDFKTAIAAAAELSADAGGPEIREALLGMVKARMEGLAAARQKGDYLTVQSTAVTLQKELAGLPEAAEVAKVASELAADKSAQEVIKGQLKMAKILSKEFKKKKEVNAAIEDLRKLKKDYPGTFVETEADARIARFSEMLREG